MIKKVIKVPFVEEVTGKPGAMVRFVEQTTVPLETTVQAAIDGLFVIGQAQLVKNNFLGLFKSMAEGVQRDGKPRKIADFLRVYPVFTGEVDLDKGYNPEQNGVYLAAALLNEMKLDISKWSFEDVTKGRKALSIDSVYGSDDDVVDAEHDMAINGHGFTNETRVEMQLDEGEVIKIAPEYVTGNVTRLDVKKEALASLGVSLEDRKLKITVRGNFANASRTVKLLGKPMPVLKVTSQITQGENEVALFTDVLTIEGTEVKNLQDAHLELFKTATGSWISRLEAMDGTGITRIDDYHVKYHITGNTSTATDSQWKAETVKLVIKRTNADDLIVPMTFVEA